MMSVEFWYLIALPAATLVLGFVFGWAIAAWSNR